MPLPILQPDREPTAQTLVRLFHQTELNWSRHLADEQILEVGTAVFNPQLPGVAQANRIFDASLQDGVSAADAMATAQAFYREKGSRLLEMVAGPSAAAGPLKDHLSEVGWSVHPRDIFKLSRRPGSSLLAIPPGVKIIPARASFRHARELAEEMTAGNGELTEAAVMHLDDPHVDALLALRDGRAVAGIAVLAMGEVGRIDQLFVSNNCRRQGLGKSMLSRALEICARALFRHVLLSVSEDEMPARELFARFGFEKVGGIDFYRPPAES